jgi:ribosome-binding factor A
MNKKRLAGIEKEFSRVISKTLYGEIRNPKIKGLISVTKVRITPDLKFADVYFSIMPVGENPLDVNEVLEGLNEIKGYLRKVVSENIDVRYIPEIRVHLDDSIEHAVKISKLLKDIQD